MRLAYTNRPFSGLDVSLPPGMSKSASSSWITSLSTVDYIAHSCQSLLDGSVAPLLCYDSAPYMPHGMSNWNEYLPSLHLDTYNTLR
jgi:hypothetical protein